tara:strand:- start:241 stop:471 length:231 start_codon:yes stop_codon:yes gene_type:complete
MAIYGQQIRRNVRSINKARKTVGLDKLKMKERECLKCGKKFKSIGINNRLCGNPACRQELFNSGNDTDDEQKISCF